MVPNDVFQKLLYDLFCMWHGVQRHYDPPIPDSEEQRMQKVCFFNLLTFSSVRQLSENNVGKMQRAKSAQHVLTERHKTVNDQPQIIRWAGNRIM